MYSIRKTYSSLPITKGYTFHINTLIKPKTIGKFFITKTKLFFHWAQTNSFLVATRVVLTITSRGGSKQKQVSVRAKTDFEKIVINLKKTRK